MRGREEAILGKIELIIPGEPTTKKNSQQIVVNRSTGRPFITQSKKYKAFEREAGWHIQQQYSGDPIKGTVNVKALFYRKTRRRVDLPNLEEAILDILVKYGVLADDNFEIVRSQDGSRVYVEPENPRTEIYITAVEE